MKRGFTFIECILAIGILSIIAVSVFPVLDSSTKVFSSTIHKNDLRTIAQSTVEILKSGDELSAIWIEELEEKNSIDVYPHYIKDRYECRINNIFDSESFIEVEVVVTNINSEDVEKLVLKASIKK